jgi:hypothetical protein
MRQHGIAEMKLLQTRVTLNGERTLRITWVLLKRLAITEIGMNQWGASKKSEKLQQLRA